jgi:hypothetical protein
MVNVTGNAAASIALRNAIFRVIPKAYVDTVYRRVQQVAIGKAETLVARRTEVVARLGKLGVTQDRVFARLEVRGIEDIGLEHLEQLIGLGTAIKNGDIPLDEAFPALAPAPAAPEQDGKRISMKGKKNEPKEPTQAPPEPADSDPPEPGSDG